MAMASVSPSGLRHPLNLEAFFTTKFFWHLKLKIIGRLKFRGEECVVQ